MALAMVREILVSVLENEPFKIIEFLPVSTHTVFWILFQFLEWWLQILVLQDEHVRLAEGSKLQRQKFYNFQRYVIKNRTLNFPNLRNIQ